MEGRVHPTATGWRGAEQDWLGYDQQQWLRFQQDGKYILELCTHTSSLTISCVECDDHVLK